MFLVGLTGGIASGKSAVSLMLKLLDCEVIDADMIAREGKILLGGVAAAKFNVLHVYL